MEAIFARDLSQLALARIDTFRIEKGVVLKQGSKVRLKARVVFPKLVRLLEL
jgi:hypothetical protein